MVGPQSLPITTFPDDRIGRGVPAEEARVASHSVYVAGDWAEAPVYDRKRLGPEARFSGPAIVAQMDATTYVLPGQTARVDPYGNLIVREAAAA